MQVELDLPETVVRKIKALNALESGHTASTLQDRIAALLEQTIDQAIASYLGPQVVSVQKPVQFYSHKHSPEVVGRRNPIEDLLPSLEDGLGDLDETEISPEDDEEVFVPKRGGLTERFLDRDMEVEDPEHEAKVDAPSLEKPYSKAEEAFAQVSGIPIPVAPSEEVDGRLSRRKKRLNIKGRVAPMTNEYEAERESF